MKKAHLFILSVFSLMLMTSCSSNIGVAEEIEEVEDVKTAPTLEIQSISLDQVNSTLSDNNIETFSSDELADFRSLRDEKPCLNAVYKGDINGDDMISTGDLLLIFDIIRKYDNKDNYPETANGDGKLEVNKEYLGEFPSFWSVVHVGKLVTYQESGSTTTYLDRYDAAVIVDLLTGSCN